MKRRQFTKEFKLEAVQQLESGMSAAEASRQYEVHPNLIGKWRELFGKYGKNAFRGHGKAYREEAKIESLEWKIAQLTMENEFLKKINKFRQAACRREGVELKAAV